VVLAARAVEEPRRGEIQRAIRKQQRNRSADRGKDEKRKRAGARAPALGWNDATT